MRSVGSVLTLCACIATATVLDGCAAGPPGSSTTDSGTGGHTSASGGSAQTGGAVGSGAVTGSGGMVGSGGSTASGGSPGTGGTIGTGGTTASGGGSGSGGVTGRGGRSAPAERPAPGARRVSAARSAPAARLARAGRAARMDGTGGARRRVAPDRDGPHGTLRHLQAAETPCAAAHSTVRALYAAYGGPCTRSNALRTRPPRTFPSVRPASPTTRCKSRSAPGPAARFRSSMISRGTGTTCG